MMNMVDEIDDVRDPAPVEIVSLLDFLDTCDRFATEARGRGLPASVCSRFDDARWAAKELHAVRTRQMGRNK